MQTSKVQKATGTKCGSVCKKLALWEHILKRHTICQLYLTAQSYTVVIIFSYTKWIVSLSIIFQIYFQLVYIGNRTLPVNIYQWISPSNDDRVPKDSGKGIPFVNQKANPLTDRVNTPMHTAQSMTRRARIQERIIKLLKIVKRIGNLNERTMFTLNNTQLPTFTRIMRRSVAYITCTIYSNFEKIQQPWYRSWQ